MSAGQVLDLRWFDTIGFGFWIGDSHTDNSNRLRRDDRDNPPKAILAEMRIEGKSMIESIG